MDYFSVETWLVVGQIILVDILLAGDNAVVIGMAASKLAPHLQKKAVFWGTGGAIGMRLIMAVLLIEALYLIPALHLIGGIVLLWIAIKLVCGDDEEHSSVKSKDSLQDAIMTIIIADAMMSIDNVLAVVAVAQGHATLVLMGILITVPIIIFCSTYIAKVINKYPIIIYFGGVLLAWVAAGMIVVDDLLVPYIAGYELYIKFGLVVLFLAICEILKRLNKDN